MSLISLLDITVSFRGPVLLDDVTLRIEPGERICLLGRNGVGKSTLMKLIDGAMEPDAGQVVPQPGLRVGRLSQEVPQDLSGTIFDRVAAGLGDQGRLLSDYHRVSHQLAETSGNGEGGKRLSDELDRLGHELDANRGWQVHQQVETVISRMQLDPDAECASLSAGMKRRVLLAGALVCNPDILLLDEPTNHLDIDTICWLEEFLLKYPATQLFVTHDRMFLRNLATRIIELDRGKLTSWSCDYPTYQKRKEETLAAEAKQRALFDKRLAQEETWIRQGIQARRTRNEGRVRALVEMRQQRQQRREVLGNVRLQMQQAERTGRMVIEAKRVFFGYEEEPVIRDFSTLITRGDRIGIIGPNGAGKTTLLRILLGDASPQQGAIRHGTNFSVAYFDQLQMQLDEEATVQENVAEGSSSVMVDGQKKHVLGYLQDFLFPPERARSPVKFLSGGERNRLMLAKLFTKPSNVLVMDEPTNDLDAETLELLEEQLLAYAGTLLLVSHDREFLNNVVTSTLVLEGEGLVKEYAGGYDDWLVQRQEGVVIEEPVEPPTKPRPRLPNDSGRPKSAARLTYNEQRELKSLPQKIEKLEIRIAAIHDTMADPTFYQQEGTVIAKAKTELDTIESELAETFARWESLEERAGQ